MININNDIINNLNCFILQNNLLHYNNFPLIMQNPMNHIHFLQRKRMYEYQKLYHNNLEVLKENINLPSINKNNFQINKFPFYYIPELGFNPLLKRSLYINENNSNLKELELNKNLNNNLIEINEKNKTENNNNINNIYYNLNKNELNDINNKNINYNINNYANIEDNINKNISNNPCLYKKTSLKNNFLFNVTHEKKKKYKKKKYNKQTESNNEIKVLKNKKIVYINTLLLNSYSTSKNIKKLNKIIFIGKNKRSSQYRDVSKNGNQWQVLMMLKKKKLYIGTYDSEEFAGRIYDILSLKNRGIKAKTNFKYTNEQIKNICKIDIDIKDKNIYEIISQLIM